MYDESKVAPPIEHKEWAGLREKVFERDGRICSYCGAQGGGIGIDHVMPVARGGGNGLCNLVVACRRCNTGKGNRTPEEWVNKISVPNPPFVVRRFAVTWCLSRVRRVKFLSRLQALNSAGVSNSRIYKFIGMSRQHFHQIIKKAKESEYEYFKCKIETKRKLEGAIKYFEINDFRGRDE